jgi:hypothetical protein
MKTTLENGTEHTLKEGDYFKWYYKTTKGMLEPYWCKSRMCKYNSRGEMKDLFWSMGDSYDHGCLALDEVSLTFLGNINDYYETTEHDMKYYDDRDLLDISHSNHSKNWGGVFFVRRDAVYSKVKIKEMLDKEMEEAQYKKISAQRDIERLDSKIVELETCEKLEEFWF